MDAENDIPMLKEAGIGVAMGNAMETAKEAASYLTDTNDNNGIGKAIDLVLPGKDDHMMRNDAKTEKAAA